jgi:hypothetical protein
MELVKNLFKKTKGLWNVSRWLMIILSLSSLLKISTNATLIENGLNSSSLIFIVLLLITIPKKYRNEKFLKLRYGTGSLALIYGLITIPFLSRLADQLDTINISLFYIIPFWCIFFGIWELLNARGEIKE